MTGVDYQVMVEAEGCCRHSSRDALLQMSLSEFLWHALQAFILAPIILILAIAIVVVLRRIGSFPTEFDRIGSDLSLYAYGIGLSLIVGIQLRRPVLSWAGSPERLVLFVFFMTLLAYVSYGVNCFLSERIRDLRRRRYSSGIETETQLIEVIVDRRGRRLLASSIALGLFPTICLLVADLLE